MMIFWDARLVLLAPPRTASMALQNALEPIADVSMRLPEELNRISAQQFGLGLGSFLSRLAGEEFQLAGLVREPVSWLGSWYGYLRNEAPLGRHGYVLPDRFDDFVVSYIRGYRHPAMALVSDQISFMRQVSGLPIEILYAYEEIELFCDYLADRLDYEIELFRVNKSPEIDLTLSAGSERLLRQHLAPDFALHRWALESRMAKMSKRAETR
jgi:hypothetical protein